MSIGGELMDKQKVVRVNNIREIPVVDGVVQLEPNTTYERANPISCKSFDAYIEAKSAEREAQRKHNMAMSAMIEAAPMAEKRKYPSRPVLRSIKGGRNG